MVRRIDARRDARALRFLLLCVGGWIAVRIMIVWNPAVAPPPDAAATPWAVPSPFAASDSLPFSAARTDADPTRGAPPQHAHILLAFAIPGPQSAAAPFTDGEQPVSRALGANRHNLRLALFTRLLPPPPGGLARSAAARNRPLWFPLAPAAPADPGRGKPFWIQRQLGGWALAGWLYLREGSGNAPETIGGAGQLGGSQAGLRLAYGFGDAGRVRAYGRATIAVQRPQQRELAFGLAFAPLAQLPVDLAIEQRVAAGKEGRTALAIMASGGVSDVALPAGFRLDAYAQVGVMGAQRRDGFADGAIVVDRRIGPEETALRLGALAAGAVQPGAARVDVGPRLTFSLPDVGEGSRIALDWRQRVAGDARPESGLAVTLATDF